MQDIDPVRAKLPAFGVPGNQFVERGTAGGIKAAGGGDAPGLVRNRLRAQVRIQAAAAGRQEFRGTSPPPPQASRRLATAVASAALVHAWLLAAEATVA